MKSINGMQVTAILSFAASCSAGGVVVLFQRDVLFCRRYPQLPCGKFELATALAFLSWALSATSALIMFWLMVGF
uniref:CASP-like protein n=1 Tax=Arundo donax TaxID=35708 RepID=A0A0A9G101_ARUDO